MDLNKKLLIWDIDGTLLTCRGGGKRAFNRAFEWMYGEKNVFDHISMAGAVDLYILKNALKKYNLNILDTEFFFDIYKKYLLDELTQTDSFYVHAGVEEILNLTENSQEFYNIVGTGNCFQGAEIKLRLSKLEVYFKTGGYGSKTECRSEMIKQAYLNGCQHYNIDFENEQTWVIGDTPADILSAKSNDFKVAAVGTGSYVLSELKKYCPNVLIEDFKTADVVMNVLSST